METKMPILKLIASLLLFVLSTTHGIAQEKLFDLPIDIRDIEKCVYDIFDNAYILTSENNLLKINDKGVEVEYQIPFGYSIDEMGLNHIHKLFLFSRDQQTVIFLDNQLTELSSISFEELGYNNVTSVDLSEEDRLWFVDADRREVIEFPANSAVLSTSFAIREVNRNLADFTLDESVNGISLIGNDCIYVYSLIGQYKSYAPFTTETILDENGDSFSIKDGMLWKVEPLMPQDVKLVTLNEDHMDWKHTSINKNSLYYLHNKGCYKMSMMSN